MECAPYLKVRAPGKLLWFTVLNDTPRCLRCWYFLTPAFCGARLLAIVAGSRINICMDVFQLLLWHFQGVCAGREVCAILCSLFLFWRSKRAGKKKKQPNKESVCYAGAWNNSFIQLFLYPFLSKYRKRCGCKCEHCFDKYCVCWHPEVWNCIKGLWEAVERHLPGRVCVTEIARAYLWNSEHRTCVLQCSCSHWFPWKLVPEHI